jgi:hypothetical protein
MKRHPNILTLALCVALFGCGSGSYSNSGGNSPSYATMQAGQWEFVATPSSGAPPVYIETNLTLAPGQVSSDPLNTLLFKFGGIVGGQFSFCNNFALNALVANGVLGGSAPGGGGLLRRYVDLVQESTRCYTVWAVSHGTSISIEEEPCREDERTTEKQVRKYCTT